MVHINSGKKMQAHTQIVEIDIHPIISQHSETADAAEENCTNAKLSHRQTQINACAGTHFFSLILQTHL